MLYSLVVLSTTLIPLSFRMMSAAAKKDLASIAFLDPGWVCETAIETMADDVEKYLVEAFAKLQYRSYIMVPYNSRFHWILLVFQLNRSRVVVMDPLMKGRDPIKKLLDLVDR